MSAARNITPIRAAVVASVLLSPAQVCELVPGMTLRKLQRFRDEGRGPAHSKLGKTIVYREADVLAWVDRARVTTREQS